MMNFKYINILFSLGLFFSLLTEASAMDAMKEEETVLNKISYTQQHKKIPPDSSECTFLNHDQYSPLVSVHVGMKDKGSSEALICYVDLQFKDQDPSMDGRGWVAGKVFTQLEQSHPAYWGDTKSVLHHLPLINGMPEIQAPKEFVDGTRVRIAGRTDECSPTTPKFSFRDNVCRQICTLQKHGMISEEMQKDIVALMGLRRFLDEIDR